MFFYFVISNTF